jgi:hypothetical protein
MCGKIHRALVRFKCTLDFFLLAHGSLQVLEKMVGAIGFEPMTSTV